ncbi:hypothetical protein [Streptomyces acidiscabies]|uniref:hypothetical protein n=1 Tax=Streptomyces acidiscabies TaxID=42234 RepID=UPI00073F4F5E|nr:hypothetical protein [Streptomyces acidiscabies]
MADSIASRTSASAPARGKGHRWSPGDTLFRTVSPRAEEQPGELTLSPPRAGGALSIARSENFESGQPPRGERRRW